MKMRNEGKLEEARIIFGKLKTEICSFVSESDYKKCSAYLEQLIQATVNVGFTKTGKVKMVFVSKMQSAMAKIHTILDTYKNILPSELITCLERGDQIVIGFQKQWNFGKRSQHTDYFGENTSTFIPYGDCFADSEFCDLNI